MMFVTNEQASSAIEQTPMLIRSSLKDVETFLKDTHHQVIFTVHEGFNTMLDRVKIDLEGTYIYIKIEDLPPTKLYEQTFYLLTFVHAHMYYRHQNDSLTVYFTNEYWCTTDHNKTNKILLLFIV